MIINIQLLRFIAALVVGLFHFTPYYERLIDSGVNGSALSFLTFIGISGVDVFFVISGFIIFQTAKKLEGGINDSLSFAYKRASRIYLGYWPFLLLMLILQWSTMPQWLDNKDLWASFFLYHAHVRELVIAVSWTLTFELLFYAAFTFLIFARAHRKPSIILLIAAIILAINTYFGIEHGLFVKDEFRKIGAAVSFSASPLLLEFLAGILLANHIQKNKIRYPGIIILIGLALIFAGGLYNYFHPEAPLGVRYNRHLRVAIFGTAAVFLVAGMIGLEQHGKKLVPKFSLLFGGASYALYLLHTIAYMALARTGGFRYIKTTFTDIPYAIEAASFIVVIAVILCSVLIYRYIELPLHTTAKQLNPFKPHHSK